MISACAMPEKYPPPASPKVNEAWVDDAGDLHVWDGNSWQPYQDLPGDTPRRDYLSDFLPLAEALGAAADAAMAVLREQVAAAMRMHGEDPEVPALFAMRVEQAAYSLNSDAHRKYEEVRHA